MIPDLRKNHDEMTKIENGTLYRKGDIVQVWWECDILGRSFDWSPVAGRETWNIGKAGGTVEEAIRWYNELIEEHPIRSKV